MPAGVPVATVAVNGGENAGLLAAQILSVKYPAIKDKLRAYKEAQRKKTLEADEALQRGLDTLQ